ncbi:MAG: glycosyltransferase family 4 protein [Clostridiales bacterium]|nr:glycosyltransferase family 4 protein [Clostridiales bacterium]
MLAIEAMRLKKIPFNLNSDGGIVKEESEIKRKFKQHFIAVASKWLSTGRGTTEYFKYYGANPKRIFVYPFTSVFEKDVLKSPVNEMEKKLLREKLDIPEEQVVLSGGQFIPRKGYDLLMKSCEGLDKNIGVYIVGGEPTEEYMSLKDKLHLTNFHFLPFMKHENLADYYKAADLFVLPTREDIWGLVINEAMAFGLPVLTTNKCVAGVEMIDGNGAVYPVDVNWGQVIEEWIKKNDKSCRKSLDIASYYTIENMARVHIEILLNR